MNETNEMNEIKSSEADSIFTRTKMLLGDSALSRLRDSKLAIVGLGGVGSYAAEAAMRSGVGELVLIDGDIVDITNINRQLYATLSTLHQKKSELAKARAMDINPSCRVSAHCERLSAENVESLIPADCDFILDAIDDIPAKLALIKYAASRNIPIICSMGMGNKLDITKLRLDKIENTSVCPLAREVRRRLRADDICGIMCVYSTEVPKIKAPTPSSMIFVPAAAGLMMAEYAISRMIGVDGAK